MLGAGDPRKTSRKDLVAFLLAVQQKGETGSNAVTRATGPGTPMDRLHNLALFFVEPPLADLEARVDSIIARDRRLEAPVNRVLAQTVRGAQEVGQQLVRASSQFSRGLRSALPNMDLSSREKARVHTCITCLDASRHLAVKALNEGLYQAKHQLENSGRPSPAAEMRAIM
jgi:hypothetical protein